MSRWPFMARRLSLKPHFTLESSRVQRTSLNMALEAVAAVETHRTAAEARVVLSKFSSLLLQIATARSYDRSINSGQFSNISARPSRCLPAGHGKARRRGVFGIVPGISTEANTPYVRRVICAPWPDVRWDPARFDKLGQFGSSG